MKGTGPSISEGGQGRNPCRLSFLRVSLRERSPRCLLSPAEGLPPNPLLGQETTLDDDGYRNEWEQDATQDEEEQRVTQALLGGHLVHVGLEVLVRLILTGALGWLAEHGDTGGAEGEVSGGGKGSLGALTKANT